jgi:nucleoside-diphosphate-sugar epimerase
MEAKKEKFRAQRAVLSCGWLGEPLAMGWAAQGLRVNGATANPQKQERLAQAGVRPFALRLGPDGAAQGDEAFFEAEVVVCCLPPGQMGADYPRLIGAVAARVREHGGKLIFTSTTGVYGRLTGLLDENAIWPPDEADAALSAKRAAEAAVWAQLPHGATILRLAGLAGPGRHPGRWLAGKAGLTGGGEAINLVHLEDVVGVVDAVIERQAWGQCFNVCADEHPLRADFYPAQALALNLPPPVFSHEHQGGGAPIGKIINNTRVKTELGYRFRHPDPRSFTY